MEKTYQSNLTDSPETETCKRKASNSSAKVSDNRANINYSIKRTSKFLGIFSESNISHSPAHPKRRTVLKSTFSLKPNNGNAYEVPKIDM